MGRVNIALRNSVSTRSFGKILTVIHSSEALKYDSSRKAVQGSFMAHDGFFFNRPFLPSDFFNFNIDMGLNGSEKRFFFKLYVATVHESLVASRVWIQ